MEPLLEGIFRKWRTREVIKRLPKKGGTLLDIGCGEGTFIRKIRKRFKKCIGIDKINNKNEGNIIFIREFIKENLPINSSDIDLITCIATLEHFKNKEKLLNEFNRVLKPKGEVIFTLPSPKAEKVLDFLAKIRLISKEQIDDHEKLLPEKTLRNLFSKTGFKILEYSYFELNYNQVIHIRKK